MLLALVLHISASLLCCYLHVSLVFSDPSANMYRESTNQYKCSRDLPGLMGHKTPGDNGFKIKITGEKEKFKPGELYTVALMGHKTSYQVQKFIGFMLMVEPREPSDPSSSSSSSHRHLQVGQFQLFGDALIKISDECPNAILHTSDIPKSEITVMWQAPSKPTGCVVFRATVVESPDIWFMDDGALTKHFCPEENESMEEQTQILAECCACREARYDVTLIGLWSKFTHPKDFPDGNNSQPHFSDLIGASHTKNFKLWNYGGHAEDGLRIFAQTGNSKKLEAYIKQHEKEIRTTIRAKGLRDPNLMGNTTAVARVSRDHHLISVVSKLAPSPDWFVGVAMLELCLKNCSWVQERQMNLYLWDAGADSGNSYLSPRQPTIPFGRISRITTTNPTDGPFFDPTIPKMKPFARLKVYKKHEFENKSCDSEESGQSNNGFYTRPASTFTDPPNDCQVTDWTEFKPCSATCGKGFRIRTRNYVHENQARQADCRIPLIEKEPCEADCIGNISCATTSWSEWSECSVTCGQGQRTRTRKLMNRIARKVCTQVELIQREPCTGPIVMCPEEAENDPKCSVTSWSEWSPCTVTCGRGMKIRTRLYLSPPQSSNNNCQVELIQKAPCQGEKQDCIMDYSAAQEICMMPKDVGPCRGYFLRWHYDYEKAMCVQFIYGGCRGNKNNFERYTDCNKMCRSITRAPISALTTLASSQPAHLQPHHYPSQSNVQSHNSAPDPPSGSSDQPVVDCVVTPWSEWSPCSRTCGNNGRKTRRRMIKLHPQNGGEECPKLVQRRKCKNMPPCQSYASTSSKENHQKVTKHKHHHHSF